MLDPSKMNKDQLKALALKQRIGEITSDYEDRLAETRADFTIQYNALQDTISQQAALIESLNDQLGKLNETEEKEDQSAKSTK
jgi:hypothetical protein